MIKKALKTIGVILMTVGASFAQLVENFDDGDFTTNPVWAGDVNEYTITGTNALRLNASVAGTSYLNTSFDGQNLSKVWKFGLQLDFAPSASNLVKIYLATDQPNLESNLNGYYLQLGEIGAGDVFRLYRKSNSAFSLLASGTTTLSSAFAVDVMVTRDNEANWRLYVKTTTNSSFGLPEFTLQDATHSAAQYFGFECIYTVTNAQRFTFDNITITSMVDNQAPELQSVTVVGQNQLQMHFNENLDIYSSTTTSNYIVDNSVGNPQSVSATNNMISATFSASFIQNTIYTLTINGIKDVSQNLASAYVTTFNYIPVTVSSPPTTSSGITFREIVINEIMADPNTLLGNTEYLELYNASNRSISVQGLVLVDGSTARTINQPVTIPSQGFLVLVPNSTNRTDLWNAVFPTSIEIITLSGLGLTNGGESLTLTMPGGALIDSYTYSSATKGKSWEQIDPTLWISGSSNWSLSQAAKGGTPGEINQPTTTSGTTPATTLPASNLGYRQVVFNEIMSDVNPKPAELPATEYIEIFNTTPNTVNIQGFVLQDYSSSGSVTNRTISNLATISGYGYLLLAGSAAATSITAFNPNIAVNVVSGLDPSQEDKYVLLNAEGNVVDQIEYKLSWYNSSTKDDGGYSLEQINPTIQCSGKFNWTAHSGNAGGTPGQANSVYELKTDEQAPSISKASISEFASLDIVFSEAMDTLTTKNIQNYSISPSITLESIRVSASRDTVRLYYSASVNIEVGKIYTLSTTGLKDCTGNVLFPQTINLGIGKKPLPTELVINEIYADESPSFGLPSGEFVELYNTTSSILDISGLTLAGFGSGSTHPVIPQSTTILPHEYLVICNSSLFAEYSMIASRVLALSISLNNTGEPLSLRAKEAVLDSINYNDDWHIIDTIEGGRSLERISVLTTCGQKYNWSTSVNAKGGTPGQINSISNTLTPQKSLTVQSVAYFPQTKAVKIAYNGALSAVAANNTLFQISGNSVSHSMAIGQDLDTLQIILSNEIKVGELQQIHWSGLQDCKNNAVLSHSVQVGRGKRPIVGDVVINEIMADENPVIGLPEAEYIELYNTTDQLLDLTNFKLADKSTIGKFGSAPTLLPSKGYLILCSTGNQAAFQPFGQVLAVSSFPSLNSDNETIKLLSDQDEVLQVVTYFDAWYGDQVKKNGGWSLEKIDPYNLCGAENNWTASVDPRGGTPGKENSVKANNPDLVAPTVAEVLGISKDSIRIQWSETPDSASAQNGNYQMLGSLSIRQILIKDKATYLSLQDSMEIGKEYELTISGVADCANNVMAQSINKYFRSMPPSPQNLILNEILFNPYTGGVDFVELHNRSGNFVDLKGMKLANRNQEGQVDDKETITDQHVNIPPHGYLALTTEVDNIKNNYPKSTDAPMLQVESMPSYPDDEGTVCVLDVHDSIIDLFDYKDEYHNRLLENKNGVSLERISPEAPSYLSVSWQSAAASAGYATPGRQNSQSKVLQTTTSPISIDPQVFSPDEDGYKDIVYISYYLEEPGYNGNFIIYDATGRVVRNLVQNQILGTTGMYSWDGTNENNEKVPMGPYMLYVNMYKTDGKKKQYTDKIVVANRFR